MNPKHLDAQHGIVCRRAGEKFGYFGWPSIARLDDDTLVAASSGLRSEHVCPWGRTVIHTSADNGCTWSAPRIINDSPLDDRDAGVIHLGDGRLLVSWFTSDTRQYRHSAGCRRKAEEDNWDAVLGTWTDDLVRRWLGSWILRSEDRGVTWSAPLRVPVSAPHGPIRLASGDLLYLGRPMGPDVDRARDSAEAWRSADGGNSWHFQGQVPPASGARGINNEEPHLVELLDGRLVGMLRFELRGKDDPAAAAGHIDFSLFQTDSADGGRTWTVPRPLGVSGSPPHLLRHSCGTLLCSYGFRKPGYGQRVLFSRDAGATWDTDWVIRDDGPDGDLGYPASVELEDGSLLTIYYQKVQGDRKCSLLWSRWRLPAALQ
ncbi:MAG: exo-alpha-sialidase [Planctomycetes bacterium]|nr:exo-alpha-sialidase [Planctomycetota bacterium]